ncbi:MAG: hypothetical protein ACJAXS_001228 [Colwellia sp.]|jgi:hypothetical protein
MGISKTTFLGPNGIVPISEVIEAYGHPVSKIEMPTIVEELINVELSMNV